MNTNVKNICEVVEDIKEKLTDCQYKIIMDNLMVLNEKRKIKKKKDFANITQL